MRLLTKLRFSSKLKCIAALLIFLSTLSITFIIIKRKTHRYNTESEIRAFLLAQDEVIYLKEDGKYYANGVYKENDKVTYQDCGDSNRIIALNHFDIEPKVLGIPKNISISVIFDIREDFHEQLQIQISISRKLPIVGYVRLPCIANYGSCVYAHVCDVYEQCPDDSFEYSILCPKWFRATGIKCKCPFKKGIYAAKAAPAYISSSLLPSWIARGDYIAHVTLEDTTPIPGEGNSSSRTLGCFKFMFRLT